MPPPTTRASVRSGSMGAELTSFSLGGRGGATPPSAVRNPDYLAFFFAAGATSMEVAVIL